MCFESLNRLCITQCIERKSSHCDPIPAILFHAEVSTSTVLNLYKIDEVCEIKSPTSREESIRCYRALRKDEHGTSYLILQAASLVPKVCRNHISVTPDS